MTQRTYAALLTCMIAGWAVAEERTERFDKDPNWEGRNNSTPRPEKRAVRQDFGYSRTAHAGGQTGEVGGFISSAAEAAYYARKIESKTFDNTLSASGTLVCKGGFHALVGFFNADTTNEWRGANTIALRVIGRGDVFYAYVEYCTGKWRAGGDSPGGFATVKNPESGRLDLRGFKTGVAHKWSLKYDPAGNKGGGVVTITLGEETAVCHLDVGHKVDGATFNRFGLLPVLKSADGGGEVWLDNVTINGETDDFANDPKWEGVGNRREYQTVDVRPWFDFGFRPSNHAGGQAAGEMGGLVFRGDCRYKDKLAAYGDRLGTLTLDKPLKASGKLALRRGVSDSTTLLGFYHSEDSLAVNPSQSSGFPRSFLGVAVEGPSREGFLLYPAYRVRGDDQGYSNNADRPHILPNGKSHDWSLTYDPTVADGRGRMVVTLDGKSVSLDLTAEDRKTGTKFDRFGLITTWIDGNAQRVYFDDLTYTSGQVEGTRVRGEVVDAATGQAIPCRIYIEGEDGTWHFPKSEAKTGSAVEYRKQRADNPRAVEMHTSLSAHPFVLTLPRGRYSVTVERGKEYLPETQAITVGQEPVELRFRLRRWIDMAALGWYSGETHVHRAAEELPTLMQAEDLNVTFPLSYWVTEAFTSPKTANKGPFQKIDAKPIALDPTHIIYPLNTEYEIFTVGKQRHTLGAFFALNHKTVLDVGTPPVKPIAERVHKEGGLIELDKHNWPWSMAIVPIAKVDLFELTNNHVWRTEFAFGSFGEPAPEYMKIERDKNGFTERGWIDYGFQNYYALLNCGFRLRPTAGTASGVHPVPLGFGRVYVYCPDKFEYDAWVHGLDRGESFVTTGPMILVRVNGKNPGTTFEAKQEYRITGEALSALPLDRVEVVVNGEVVRTIKPANTPREPGGYSSAIDEKLTIDGSSWLAVRCYESLPKNRTRFAHTAPFHIVIPDKPLRPRAVEIEFLIRRVEEQIARSKDVLPPAALEEYREALQAYRAVKKAMERGQ